MGKGLLGACLWGHSGRTGLPAPGLCSLLGAGGRAGTETHSTRSDGPRRSAHAHPQPGGPASTRSPQGADSSPGSRVPGTPAALRGPAPTPALRARPASWCARGEREETDCEAGMQARGVSEDVVTGRRLPGPHGEPADSPPARLIPTASQVPGPQRAKRTRGSPRGRGRWRP